MIEPDLARAIISKLGESGTPPEFGIDYFTVGIDRFLRVVEEEYLKGILKFGLSSFKIVIGSYGGGKTHFLYSVRNIAWRNNYAVSYVSLNPTECPFDKLELVYKQIASGISAPVKDAAMTKPMDKGIDSLLRLWFDDVERRVGADEKKLSAYLIDVKGLESSSFTNAVRGCFLNMMNCNADGYDAVLQWLKGEEVTKDVRATYRISERIDRTTAFRMLRSLIQWVNLIGYTGLILLFDEAERGMSISSSKDRRRALDNLRQIVDECGNSRLPGAMFFYAVPDENLLLEGAGGVYEALKQRLRSAFSETNPNGVKINLESLSVDAQSFLTTVGYRLASIFEAAHQSRFEEAVLRQSIENLARVTLEFRELDIGYRRIFVVSLVELLETLRAAPAEVITKDRAEQMLRTTSRSLEQSRVDAVEREEY